MAAPTPGPWTWGMTSLTISAAVQGADSIGERYLIAAVNDEFPEWAPSDGWPEANARLIAEAPNLLEAAEKWIAHLALHERSDHPKANMFCTGDGTTDCASYAERFRAAIARAKGEAS